MDYPGNSYKQRGVKRSSPMPSPIKPRDDRGYYYVRIKYTIWPEIYGEELPISFPTFKSAMRFAENNCSTNKPSIRVYTPEGELIKTFVY